VTAPDLKAASDRWHSIRHFLRQRLDPKSELGLRLTINVVLFAFAVWAFAGLLEEVLDNEALVRWDVSVNSWLHAHATPTGLRFFGLITLIGSPGAWIVTALVTIWLLWRRERFLVWAWLASNAGGGLLQLVLKATVHRNRPQYAAAYLHGQSYSFPSGHTMSATICFSLLVVCAGLSLGWHGARRARLYVASTVLVLAIGFSRLYLGVHYPSDVLGGLVAGAAWVVLCTTTIRIVQGREAARERAAATR
jgi:membrane-associated phospholipid phosphatase